MYNSKTVFLVFFSVSKVVVVVVVVASLNIFVDRAILCNIIFYYHILPFTTSFKCFC